MGGVSRRSGIGMLVVATVLWGTTFLVVQHAVVTTAPSVMTLGRFAVAAAVLLPFARRDRRMWRVGMELSVWLCLGYATQAIGLQYTSSSRSAFITALNVIFVPMLAVGVGRRVGWIVWVAALGALIGTALLSYDGSPPNLGDLWTLGTAVTYAVYIVRMERYAPQFEPLSFTLTQMVGVVALSAVWVGLERPAMPSIPWVAIVYLGVAATAGTTWLAAVAQKVVPAAQTAVIYTLEPVWATFFAFLWLGEMLSAQGLLGAGLIILCAIIAQKPPAGATEEPAR